MLKLFANYIYQRIERFRPSVSTYAIEVQNFVNEKIGNLSLEDEEEEEENK